jgi:hypothetical protein
LNGNTTYYAKAFATNNTGTEYGSEISFTTYQAPSSISCTGWGGPNATSSLMNAQGWITAQVGQEIDIYQQSPFSGITCASGPNASTNNSTIINPVAAIVTEYFCGSNGTSHIREKIIIPNPGIYQVTVKCGQTGYRTCVLSIEVIP